VLAVPRTAPHLEFESFDEAHRQACSKTVADVLRPMSIASIFARAAGADDRRASASRLSRIR
jgi:hypothetical protein